MSLQPAVEAKSPKEQLSALLTEWRKVRHPRIAALVDRLSAQLVTGPVKAKSVPARMKACLELLETKDPVSIGEVLATPWPGTWQAATPLFEALAEIPDDPRLASVLAKQIELTPWHSRQTPPLWRAIFRRFNQLRDVRALPMLREQVKRAKPSIIAAELERLAGNTVEVLEGFEVPTLSAKEDALLAQLEQKVPAKSALNGRDGDALLAAVYANPGDLGARAVYGDWLLERQDPRGELISLQLGARSVKSDARIKNLIAKHWKTWLSPITDWLNSPAATPAPQAPTFKAGFPSRASVNAVSSQRDPQALIALLDRPEWSTFEHLEHWPRNLVPLEEALARPGFRTVRSLGFTLKATEVDALLELPQKLEELPASSYRDLFAPRVGELRSLKRLRLSDVLDVKGYRDVLPRLERVFVERLDPDAEVIRLLEASGVPELEFGGAVLSRARGEKTFTSVTNSGSLSERDRKTLELFSGITIPEPVVEPFLEIRTGQLNLDELSTFTALWKVLTELFDLRFDHFCGKGGFDAAYVPIEDTPVTAFHNRVKRRGSTLSLVQRGEYAYAAFIRNGDSPHTMMITAPIRTVEQFMIAIDALMALVKPSELVVHKAKAFATERQGIEALVRATLKASTG